MFGIIAIYPCVAGVKREEKDAALDIWHGFGMRGVWSRHDKRRETSMENGEPLLVRLLLAAADGRY